MHLRRRVVVGGTREFNDYGLLASKLVHLFSSKGLKPSDIEIVTGGADGADDFAEIFANILIDKGFDIKLKVMNADWRMGNSAGYVRNLEMALYAKSMPDPLCIVFWDGVSDGTRRMINIAKKEGLELHIVRYKED